MKLTIRLKGGPGSGHHGHKGIPGHRGGSLPREGSAASSSSKSNIDIGRDGIGGKFYYGNSMSIRDLSDQVVYRYGMNSFVNMYGNDKKAFLADLKKRLRDSSISLTAQEQKDLYSEVERQYDWHRPQNNFKPVTPSKPVTSPKRENSSSFNVSNLSSEKNLTNESAQKYVKEIAGIMEKKGLYPYLSKNYSDSQFGGLNTYASNTQNWTISDGDYKGKVTPAAKPGEYSIGVSVFGKKNGIRYYDTSDGGFSPITTDVERVGSRIKTALKSAGIDNVTVRASGWDAGYGTYNVNYAIIIPKK